MSEGRISEYQNRNRLSELLFMDGFGVFVPLIDSGIDLIAYREAVKEVRLIQQKSRWTVGRKYLGRDLWIAFPDGEAWFCVPHDRLLEMAPAGVASLRSWNEKGLYHRAPLGKVLRERLAEWRIGAAG